MAGATFDGMGPSTRVFVSLAANDVQFFNSVTAGDKVTPIGAQVEIPPVHYVSRSENGI